MPRRAAKRGWARSSQASRRATDAEAQLGFYAYRVRDVMSRPAVTIEQSDSLLEAAETMVARGVSGFPVLNRQGSLVGVLSQKDVLRLLHTGAGLALPGGLFSLLIAPGEESRADLVRRCRSTLESTQVGEAMSIPPISIGASETVNEAIRALLSHHVNRLPVMHRDRLVGIVTRSDLLGAGQEAGETRPRSVRPKPGRAKR